jgi:hypothetical protein
MRKRQKFVFSAILSALAILFAQAAPLEWRYFLIALIAMFTYVLSAWSLREGLAGIEWLTVVVPPSLFTLAGGLFYILLPGPLWSRVLITAIFAIGNYALLLSGNIFSVAAIRTIALLRAAQTVGLVMTLLTGFLLFDTIFSFRLGFWWIGPLVAIASFLLTISSLWSVEVGEKLNRQILILSLYIALFMGIFAVVITFWPVTLAVSSLFLTTMLYCLVGVTQHSLSERLFDKTIWEYIVVGGVVIVTMLVTSMI